MVTRRDGWEEEEEQSGEGRERRDEEELCQMTRTPCVNRTVGIMTYKPHPPPPLSHTVIKVQFGHLEGVGFAVPAAEAEHNDRLQLSLHDHLDHFEAAGWALGPALPSLLLTPRPPILKHGHGCLKVVFTEGALRREGEGL